MKKLLILILALSIKSSAQLPKTFILDTKRLQQVKTNLAKKDPTALLLIDSLKKQADKFLSMKPVSVMDKAFTPLSGDKHDYMSQAPYFWYDSSKTNGLPYMRRDGVRNPEINKITDRRNIGELEQATKTLALAYYFTGDEKYSEKAATLLRHWFFNESTKMNPNLEHAQAIPGVNHGRGIGIIESRALTGIADASGLLQGSKSWTSSDEKKLKQWYSDYLSWMLTSKNGIDERNAKNNHGTWYDVQVIDFALFIGDKIKAKELAEGSKKRMDTQFTKEGKQPLELARTNALGYSTMNLRGWFELATLAEQAGVNLWQYKNHNAAGIQTVVDWLLPYALGEKEWTHQQIGGYNKTEFLPILFMAGEKYKDMRYHEKAVSIKTSERNLMTMLLYEK